jgi:hypothetical protein
VFDTIPIGVLAQSTFTLSFRYVTRRHDIPNKLILSSNAVATILCFGALGGVATAFIATLGPLTGLRTMVITRFSSGYIGGTIYSVLNILTQCG